MITTKSIQRKRRAISTDRQMCMKRSYNCLFKKEKKSLAYCKLLICSSLGLSTLAYGQASAQDTPDGDGGWSISLDAGIVASPSYLGDDDYQISAFPNLSINYGNQFFASLDGVGYNLIANENWRVGPIFRYQFERDEGGSNPTAIAGNKTTDLIGLGSVPGTVELGGFVEYKVKNFQTSVEVRQGINGHKGLIGEISANYNLQINMLGKSTFYSLGPNVSFGNNDFTSAYFDVNAAQSLASGLSQYDADGGINSVGADSSLVYPVTDKLSLVLFANYSRLLGDISKSSLIQQRGSKNQGTGGILLSYKF